MLIKSHKLIKRGFSLIELLVVITIVSILAAVAAPMYKSYAYRVKILEAFYIMNDIRDTMVMQYNQTGKIVSPIMYNGVNLYSGTDYGVVVEFGSIYAIMVDPLNPAPGAYTSYYGRQQLLYPGAVMEAWISGLNGMTATISGNNYEYSPPTGGSSNFKGLSSGTISSLFYAFTITPNGVVSTYCGTYDTSDTISIPLQFLPSVCTCTQLFTMANSGFIYNPC